MRCVPKILHILRFKIKTNNMAVSVSDKFDSRECLKRKVKEMQHIRNSTFVIESTPTPAPPNPNTNPTTKHQ